MEASKIVQVLNAYRSEAVAARQGGPSRRDDTWNANVNLYWNRMDFSNKAPWQSKQVMPEIPLIVDRWAAAIRDALDHSGQFFTIIVPGDEDGVLASKLQKLLNYWLDRAGPALTGQAEGFSVVFEAQLKLAALMAGAASVTYDHGAKRTTIEAFDPREVWLDPTGRGLYRTRRREVDMHTLRKLSQGKKPLYDPAAVERLREMIDLKMAKEKEELTGTAQPSQSGITSTTRQVVTLDEYLATILDDDGKVAYEKKLFVVGNEVELLRGPEDNPFWHDREWVVFSPMIPVPLSIYGKSYVENWSSVAVAFSEMTNLILDGTTMSVLRAYVGDIDKFEDPNQLLEGISPGKLFQVNGEDPSKVIHELELGTLPAEALTVWKSLQQRTYEGAGMNEIGIGQLPNSGEHSATAVTEANANSTALVRSIARAIEDRLLVPQLQLALMVGLQHMPKADPDLISLLGEEWNTTIYQRRREIVKKQYVIRVRGISEFIERAEQLRNLMGLFGVLGRVPALVQAFLAKFDVNKVLERVMLLSNVPAADFELSELDKKKAALLASVAPPAAPGGAPGGGGPAGSAPANPVPPAGMIAQGAPGNPAEVARAAGSMMGG